MLKQLLPSARDRKPHYSFMRPGDFGMFIFLIGMTAFRFYSAFTSDRTGLNKAAWHGGAILSLLLVIWFVWIRVRRRHLCAESGELMIASFGPLFFTDICGHIADGLFHWSWLLDFGFLAALFYFAYQVWRAPKIALELEARLNACETKDFTEQGGV